MRGACSEAAGQVSKLLKLQVVFRAKCWVSKAVSPKIVEWHAAYISHILILVPPPSLSNLFQPHEV